MGQANDRLVKAGIVMKRPKSVVGAARVVKSAERQRDAGGEHAGQEFARRLLLQTPFLHCGVRGQRPFRLENGEGILVESRLCGDEDILGAALCLGRKRTRMFSVIGLTWAERTEGKRSRRPPMAPASSDRCRRPGQ